MSVDINTISEGTDVVIKVKKVEVTAIFRGVSTKYPGYANVEYQGRKMPRKILRVGSVAPTRIVGGHAVPAPAPPVEENEVLTNPDQAYEDDTVSPHKISVMTKSAVRGMRPDIEAALAEVERKFGVKVSLGNASYDSTHVRFKSVEFTIGASEEDVERNQFTRNAVNQWSSSLDRSITAEDYGKRFTCRGRNYTFTGCNPKGQRFIWKGRDAASGKTFKFTDSTISDLH